MKTRTTKRGLPLLFLCAFALLPGCLPNSETEALRAQVTQHEQVLQRLNSQLSGVQPAQADTWSQVQTLRQEVATLRGEVENLSHAFSQAGGAQAMSDMLARHDRALRLIETQLAMDLQLDSPGAVPPGTAAPLPGVGMPSAPVTAAPPAPVTAPPAAPARPAAQADTAQVLYDTGMNAFNGRNYQQALKAFSDFTTTYPQHNLTANSWFWQGESSYQLKNYAAAALAYEKVISSYPNNSKAPSAYLKQGLSFAQLGKKDAARERLNQLIQKYPKAPEATRAKQELANLK